MRKLYKAVALGTAAFLAWILLPFCARATTIVVLQTKYTVLLGADARVIALRASSEGQTTTADEMCKIIRTPRTAVAVAGILGDLNGFDSVSFLQENLSEDATLEVSADTLARKAVEPLGTMIRQLEQAAPDQTLIQPGRPALSVVLSRFEGGVMKVAIRDVFYLGHSAGAPAFRIQSTNCPGNCASPNMVFATGANTAITNFLLSRFERSRLKDPAFALKLLRMEAGAEPGIVAPPFSILEGDRDGFRWIEPGACQSGAVTASTPARPLPGGSK